MATAQASDVRLDGNGGVIAVADPNDAGVEEGLTDTDIESYISDAEFEAKRANPDFDEWSDERKIQLTKYYAAYLIRTLADKPIQSTSRETASVSYEGQSLTIDQLREKVQARDPSNSLASMRNTDRYSGSTYRNEH